MGYYRKKPVVIEAWQWRGQTGDGWPDWMQNYSCVGNSIGTLEVSGGVIGLNIPTLEGNMMVSFGDWIIKGVKGELYPCKPDIFAETYEPAEPHPSSLGG